MKTKQFTLVELLVVIGIIAILAGMIIPVAGRAMDRADEASCSNNMRQLGQAESMFANDNGNYLVPSSTYKKTGGDDGKNTPYWFEALFPYVKEWAVFTCPNAARTMNVYGDVATSSYKAGMGDTIKLGYVASLKVHPSGKHETGKTYKVKRYDFERPAQIISFAPGGMKTPDFYGIVSGDLVSPENSEGNDSYCQLKRHGRVRANFLFVDGHVESIDGATMWTSKKTSGGKTYYKYWDDEYWQ